MKNDTEKTEQLKWNKGIITLDIHEIQNHLGMAC